ncbi:hypothetical protein ACPPVU_10160 [Mucilaginibacter sp. McL0603]|uniref:hypothetical protein n=1 Tax=Mucilaginibacter sp. McL0603 TaxID=3415670 RepID=UPI003CE88CA2
MKETDINKIVKFWEWFKLISDDLLRAPTRPDLISKIDDSVNKLGSFDWEIGPYKKGEYYFAISPNLDINKLEVTREFITYAPVCPGWTFLSSKPPKDWKGIWKMANENGKDIWIDSNNWRYILYKFEEDETFDMDIIVDHIEGDINTIHMAIDIGLTGYLGEEKFITLIKHIKIISFPEEGYQNKTTLVKHIKNHIESLTQM